MTHTRWATWFLLLASTMTILASATLAPAMPAMTEAFSALPSAEFWVKMTLTLPGLVIALCAPLAGALVDRWNSQKLLMYALAAFAVSGFLGFYWQASLWLILFSRALMGSAVALIMVSCTTIASRYFEGPNFSRYMGWQAAFGGFGGVLFLSIAGVLAEQHWTWVFAIYGLSLLVLPGVWRFVKAPPLQDQDSSKTTPATKWMSQAFAGCCVLAFVEIIVLYGLTIHLPFYLSHHHASATEIGFVIAGFLLAMSCLSMSYGYFRRYFGIKQLHMIGWIVIALGFAFLSVVETIPRIVCSSLIVGTGLGLIRPNLVVWLFEFVPPMMRGKAMGIMMTCYFTGQFMSPVLLEPLTSSLGYALFFRSLAVIISMVVVVVCLTYFMWLSKRQADVI